jgi:predicted esterase
MTDTLLGYEYLYERHKGPRTLLLLHGTGGNERDMLELGEQLDPDAHMLSIRGNVSENGMSRYFKRLSEGVLDREDLGKRSAEIAAFIRAAAQEHDIDLSETVGIGFSNGANMLLHLVCSQPKLLKAAMLLRPISAALPDSTGQLDRLDIFIGAGESDPTVPPGDSKRLESVLRAAGGTSALRVTPNAHGLGADDLTLAREWLIDLS